MKEEQRRGKERKEKKERKKEGEKKGEDEEKSSNFNHRVTGVFNSAVSAHLAEVDSEVARLHVGHLQHASVMAGIEAPRAHAIGLPRGQR